MFMKTARAKHFQHNLVTLCDLETETRDGKRYYLTPCGPLPSVTTVLGERLSKDHIKKWKERVGEEEAQKVLNQASKRGSAVHQLAEDYLMNKENWHRGAMPVNVDTFMKIKPFLDSNVGSVYGIEVPLWSKKLKTAGRCDLLAGYRGFNSVIDFKTSKRIKKEEDIESYFLQATCYSLMAEELTGFKFPQIVILMAVDHEDPLVFVRPRDLYVDRVLEVFT